MIEIDGTNTGALNVDAILHFMPTADGSTVRGLVLNRAASSGILVEGTDGLVIEGNFIGTNPAGTAGLGNAFVGILLNTGPANVTIGGTTPAARNLISGNTFNGIIFGQAGGAGGGGTNHLVQGNLIGTDASGGNAIPGQQKGIETLGTTSNILIGGTTAAARNVVSGNIDYGIRFRGTGAGKVASGNYVGTNPAGDAPVPNESYGIEVEATDVLVGGTAEGAGNLASGNGLNGINIFQAVGAVVQGNLVGTDATGTFAIGNGTDGIVVGANGTIVGGVGPGEANTVAYNLGSGIEVQGLTAALNGNPIRGNSIYANGGIGIDLGGDGVTANDALDADGGPNSRQNYPIVVSAVPTLADTPFGTHVEGTLDSAASTAYTLDFYANPPCEGRPQDFTEGLLYLGSIDVVTDGTGHTPFSADLAFTIEVGQPVTVTATDPNGNTSELSPRIIFSISPVSGPPAGGTLFAIFGTDFEDGATVSVGGQPATDVFVTSPTQISARTPALPAGTLGNVVVTNPSGIIGTLSSGYVANFIDVPLGNTSSTPSSPLSSATASRRASAAGTTAWRTRRSASRWRCSSSRASTESATFRRPARASSRTSPAHREPASATGSRSSRRRASRAAAERASIARRTRFDATRWPSSSSRPSTGRATFRPAAMAILPTSPAPRSSPTGSSNWRPSRSRPAAAAGTTAR